MSVVTKILPAYAYFQYSDDPNIVAFFTAYNGITLSAPIAINSISWDAGVATVVSTVPTNIALNSTFSVIISGVTPYYYNTAQTTVNTYADPGSATETVPFGATSVLIETYGGGGGGMADDYGANQTYGGGGGAYSAITMEVVAGDVLSFTVGSGGLGSLESDPQYTPGANGQASSVTGYVYGGIVNISAGGGGGAYYDADTSTFLPGAGGVAIGCDVSKNGNPGDPITGDGGKAAGLLGGVGGLFDNDGGTGEGANPPYVGSPYGGGGGGAIGYADAGNGANGLVVFTYFGTTDVVDSLCVIATVTSTDTKTFTYELPLESADPATVNGFWQYCPSQPASQGYLDLVNALNLPNYLVHTGALLDWVGASLYGQSRANLATASPIMIGPYNTYQMNTLQFNQIKRIFPFGETPVILTDANYISILQWNNYKGDGYQCTFRWLKRRIQRFLYGTFEVNCIPTPNPEETYNVGVQFLGDYAIQIEIPETNPNSLVLKACILSRVLEIPDQYIYTVQLV
jgi:hypothetical protein